MAVVTAVTIKFTEMEKSKEVNANVIAVVLSGSFQVFSNL